VKIILAVCLFVCLFVFAEKSQNELSPPLLALTSQSRCPDYMVYSFFDYLRVISRDKVIFLKKIKTKTKNPHMI